MQFKSKLIQAPLAGYSCAPFRKLAWQWGQPDFCCSEMLSAKHIANGFQQKSRYRYKDPAEGPLCIQLAGDDPALLASAAATVVNWGADFIDLNCGCPQPKIRKKNYGSQLLENSQHLYCLIKALKSAVEIPVLVKIRVDSHSGDGFNLDVAKAVQDAGADALTVHGRHWTERYDKAVNYHDIAQIKQAVDIPVIGNGDVSDTASAKRMFDETGCNALMIARASVGQPWLFKKIHEELLGGDYREPEVKVIGEVFVAHVKGLVELENEKPAILQSRKLGKYYARDKISNVAKFLEELYQVESIEQFEKVVTAHFR